MSVYVKNINGATGHTCQCGSWLHHWENISGKRAGVCAEVRCGKLASEGAHVQKSRNHNASWYIIPLCQKHNAMRGGELEIVEYIPLVLANKQNTCEL